MNAALILKRQRTRLARQGATRQGAADQQSVLMSRAVVPALFALLLVATFDLGYRAFREVANVPIKQVSVNGDFRFLDKTKVEDLIIPHLGTGYFLVDLPKIRSELAQLPLVHEVTVRRAWPDRLLVFITEQVPVLNFGDDAYLNPYGQVFRPGHKLAGLDLPTVNGPEGSEELLLKQFETISEAMDPLGLRIRQLGLDGKHAWRMHLSNDSEIFLGRRHVGDKIKLLAALLNGKLAEDRDRIARLDMRYSNGIAVAWKAKDDTGKGTTTHIAATASAR